MKKTLSLLAFILFFILNISAQHPDNNYIPIQTTILDDDDNGLVSGHNFEANSFSDIQNSNPVTQNLPIGVYDQSGKLIAKLPNNKQLDWLVPGVYFIEVNGLRTIHHIGKFSFSLNY